MKHNQSLFKILQKIIFCILILCIITSCNRKNKKISLGYVDSGLTGLAVQVMKDDSIPQKYGLDFDYQGFPNPTASNNAFILNKYDINIAAGANVIALARNKGYKVKYFYPTLLNSVSLLVKTDSPYKLLEDLKGKKIGWYGLASGGGTAFYVLSNIMGVNILKDFEMVQSSPPALWPMLDRGDVEAIIIYEPFVSRMLATKEYRVVLGPFWKEWEKRTGYKMEMTGIAAKSEWLSENPEITKKIINMWQETVDSIKSHPRKILQKYPTFTNIQSIEELDLGVKNIPIIYVDNWDNLDKSIDTMLTILVKDEVLINKFPDNMILRIK